ncbi:ketopantoate reductase family protein [Scopulibacillus cellulosilyticus]|uniref:2-dehydropantoate 2-reductase n=1 Tax=Scopulibacillus cellulosilyticus TaxID=2665665 RepID=A0ABW2PTT2_9BACL
MNILVIGAGALGVYYGGRLLEKGSNVSFLVRKNRARQIKENGLVIHSVKGDYTLEDARVVTDPDEAGECDIVILAVKGYHLEGTLPQLKKFVNKGAKVLPLLNGIEHIHQLQAELGEEAVLGGLAFIIATLDEKGHVVHTSSSHDLIFGPLDPAQHDICNELNEALENANMKARMSGNILQDLWKKYMFITAFSGITTAVNLPIGQIRKHQSTFQLGEKVLNEMKMLANSYDASISDQDVENGVNQLSQLPDEATSSMHQDRRKGLPLEVEHLQGGALRLAKQKEIALPVIETLYAVIKPFEKGN